MSSSKNSRKFYDSSFKLSVVEDALSGTLSLCELCKKYSIPRPGQIQGWIRIFAPRFKHDPMKNNPAVSPEEEIARLKRALQQKELELNRERMRADLSDKIISVAEELYGLPIRKKVGTKQ